MFGSVSNSSHRILNFSASAVDIGADFHLDGSGKGKRPAPMAWALTGALLTPLVDRYMYSDIFRTVYSA